MGDSRKPWFKSKFIINLKIMTYKCPQCPYTATEPGMCPTCNVALVPAEESTPETPVAETPATPEAPVAPETPETPAV